jgi:hypothetical protein
MTLKNGCKFMLIPLLLGGALVQAGCDGGSESHYRTISDAARDGAIERGWVPAILQPDAENIHESHDLDSSRGSGSFTLNSSLLRRLTSSCTPSHGVQSVAHPHHWWDRPAINKKDGTGSQILQCGRFLVEIDPAHQVGYFRTLP